MTIAAAPSSASARAMPRPMPVAPPVTTARAPVISTATSAPGHSEATLGNEVAHDLVGSAGDRVAVAADVFEHPVVRRAIDRMDVALAVEADHLDQQRTDLLAQPRVDQLH